MTNKVFILVFLTYISLVASTLAPFITKCKSDDLKCLKESAQKAIPLFADGIPELNVDKHDPIVLQRVDASTSNLKMIVTDIKMTGLKNCEVKEIKRDTEAKKLVIKILCAVDFDANYEMDGQLTVLPILGNGKLFAHIPKIEIYVVLHYVDKTGKDGEKHWKVKSWTHSFKLLEKSNVKFTNLFPDNEILRKPIEDLVASNGNDVITEAGPGIIEALIAKVIESINHLFDKCPSKDLAIDY